MTPYVIVGTIMAVAAVNMILYDRIPRKLLVPIGIAGWLLVLAIGTCFAFLAWAIGTNLSPVFSTGPAFRPVSRALGQLQHELKCDRLPGRAAQS